MAMVCPQCATSFEQRLQCPTCGVRLHYRDSREGEGRFSGGSTRWQQTTWGRILIGLLLAQGLFYGFRHLCTAVLLGLQDEVAVENSLNSLQGFLILQGLQILALILGCVLAGGGQRQGALLGLVVGLWNGTLSVLVLSNPVQALTTVAIYGQPLVHGAFGALGGLIGCLVWKPLPAAGGPGASKLVRKLGGGGNKRKVPLFAGKVAWIRVILGTAIAVAGTLSATVILNLVEEVSQGKLSTKSDFQDEIVTWEVKALALVVGGLLAGSTRNNGLKQGLLVGIAAGAILVGIPLGANRGSPPILAATMIGAVGFCLVGGYFGSQLFPPVVPFRVRGLGPASL
jgi:hypothetical protein